jgi:hypothetical protein
MELDEEFGNIPLEKERIIYPAYQTTNRFHNLYTDVRTWVRELIQNADDANAKCIDFKIELPEKIHVKNNGHAFNSNDIKRLLTPCLGGKEFDKTGAMNLGALSVLSIADEVFYHSGHTALKFEMNHELEDFVPYINRNYEKYFEGTQLFLPLHSRLSSDDLKRLNHIDEYLANYSHLLFTKNLDTISLTYPKREIKIKKTIKKQFSYRYRFKKIDLRKIEIIQTSTKNRTLLGEKKTKTKNTWLIAEKKIKVSKQFFTEKELQQITGKPSIPLYLAFFLEDDLPKRVNFPIYIIFPSETDLGLGFALSSNFRPETSRKGFCTEGLDGEFNNELLKKAAELIKIVLMYFKEKISSASKQKGAKLFNALLNILFYRDTYTPLESYIKKYLVSSIKDFLKQNLYGTNGEWDKASNFAIASAELIPFFKNHYHIIYEPLNENVKALLKEIGVEELDVEDLVHVLIEGEFKTIKYLKDIWQFLAINQKKLDRRLRKLLLSNPTLPNNLGRIKKPFTLCIPNKNAVDLYNQNKVLHPEFVKEYTIKSFVKRLGVKKIKPGHILSYFIARKSVLGKKDISLIKKYYTYFYKHGLWDKKNNIILTNKGFKNPNECFFNQDEIKDILKSSIPIIPNQIAHSKICKLYLKNLGVSEKITPNYVIKYIEKFGSSVINLKLLEFLSRHLNNLRSKDIKKLEDMKLIPVHGTFVKPSECYLLRQKTKKILGNLVFYFDPQEEKNEEWITFFKKIGLRIEPTITDLRAALNDCISNEYKYLERSNKKQKEKVLERIELILKAIEENKEKEAKNKFLLDLRTKQFIPTTKGIKKPYETYLQKPEIRKLLDDFGAYSLIKIPNNMISKLGINKKPVSEDVAQYLLEVLITQKHLETNNSQGDPCKKLDSIYSFLGRQDNYSRLKMGTIKKLSHKPIIYLPTQDTFEKPSRLILYSKEAKKIFRSENLVKYSDYPNSLNFFKKVGVKTSVSTNEIAQYLLNYVQEGSIEIQELFMLYHLIGQRFEFLDKKIAEKLKSSKIVINKSLDSFEAPHNIFINDEKGYSQKFPSIKIAAINKEILRFLEKVGVKKVSDVINKEVRFSGEPIKTNYSKSIEKTIQNLIPILNIIKQESNISYNRGWKRRFRTLKCRVFSEIYQELKYKRKRARLEGNYIGYDSKKNMIGIKKGLNDHRSSLFFMMLSKSIASIIFQDTPEQIKLISPLIEKILHSEDKISTLKNLGFSTLKLEAQERNIPNFSLNIKDNIKEKGSGEEILNNRYSVKKKANSPYGKIERVSNMGKSGLFKRTEKIQIRYKKEPDKKHIIQYVKHFHKEFKNGRDSSSYPDNTKLIKKLKKIDKRTFKSIESSGHVDYGGLDYTPSIPKLDLVKNNGFSFYKEQGLKNVLNIAEIKKFSEMMSFIIDAMDGNPETVIIAFFNAPVNAVNYNGQLLFNWYLMKENSLSLPPHLIWIFTAAHELAHNFVDSHNQLHSKYMMVFAIKGIMKLPEIREKYSQLYE